MEKGKCELSSFSLLLIFSSRLHLRRLITCRTGLMWPGWIKKRLVCYQPEESRAMLSAQHASKEHHVTVHTLFVEPFNPIIGAQYIVLGETENAEGVGVMVRARVLNCVDGVNVALLQKAINEQRSFFRERECRQGKDEQPADAT
ncbi:CST complex subunit TEN1 isoform X1 [Scophthalmus maximus]|uniref:CST complex subunit TEN1 isoform X1 n=1 Tax=Scophthalmus maximus TaxID=52904 RepID=UPI001FA8FE44|nr:CST complex subunit TEN1 isoform X1 [Scophthalmus maximus]